MTLCGSLCATPPPPASRGATDPPTHCQMDLQAFAKLAKLRGVERSGLSNEVRLWIPSVRPTSTARHANSALPPQAVFRQLDGDGSNDLSKAEVAGLKELVDQHNAKKAASQNPDEMVTFEEFEQLFQPGGKRRLPPPLLAQPASNPAFPPPFTSCVVDAHPGRVARRRSRANGTRIQG